MWQSRPSGNKERVWIELKDQVLWWWRREIDQVVEQSEAFKELKKRQNKHLKYKKKWVQKVGVCMCSTLPCMTFIVICVD